MLFSPQTRCAAFALALFFLMPLFASAQDNSGWIFKSEKDYVKVYYRKNSGIYELKLVTSLKTSASGLVLLFSEVDLYPKWGYKIMESRLLRKVSDHEVYYYSKIDFPWPMNDRDIIMHTRLEQDPDTKQVIATSVAVPDYIPENPDVIRIKNAHTTWTLISGKDGWLYAEYYIFTDPGGNIPDWAVNLALDMGPRETIKRIRGIIQQPKYQSVKLAYIKE